MISGGSICFIKVSGLQTSKVKPETLKLIFVVRQYEPPEIPSRRRYISARNNCMGKVTLFAFERSLSRAVQSISIYREPIRIFQIDAGFPGAIAPSLPTRSQPLFTM